MIRLASASLLTWLGAAHLDGDDTVSLLQRKLQEGLEDEHLGDTEGTEAGESKYYWAGKNGDAFRTGGAAYNVPTHLDAGPAWSWHEENNGLVRAAPLIDDKKNIYLASIAGNVYKFSPGGKVLWTHRAGASIPDVPALMDGALYATTNRGEVIALDMETGEQRWKKKVARASAGDTWSMTASDGIVVAALSQIGAQNGYIAALTAADGTELWTFKPKFAVYNSLSAVRNGSLVLSDLTGRVYRLNLKDGKLVWESPPGLGGKEKEGFTTGGAVIGPNGLVYVTSNAKSSPFDKGHGYVTAFKFDDGSLVWRKGTEYQANNAAAVGRMGNQMAVVVGVGENPDMPDATMQMLKIAPKKEKKGRILALSAETGDELWRLELPTWHGWAAGDTISHVCLPDSFGNPAISGDGTVFVGFESGLFYAVNDRNNDGRISEDEVSSYDTKNAFQGSPGLAPGMVVATPCNGMHVFRTNE